MITDPMERTNMNPIFAAAIGAVIRIRRVCPKCGSSQVVPRGEEEKTVICKKCGTEIPSLRAEAPEMSSQ